MVNTYPKDSGYPLHHMILFYTDMNEIVFIMFVKEHSPFFGKPAKFFNQTNK